MVVNFIISSSVIIISNLLLIFFVFYNVWSLNEIITFYIAETIIVELVIMFCVAFNKDYRKEIIDLFLPVIRFGEDMSVVVFFFFFFCFIAVFVMLSIMYSNFIFNYMLNPSGIIYYKYLYRIRWLLLISLTGYIIQIYSKKFNNIKDDEKKEFETVAIVFTSRWSLIPLIGIFGVFGIDICGNKENILFPLLFLAIKLVCDFIGIFVSLRYKTNNKKNRGWINI